MMDELTLQGQTRVNNVSYTMDQIDVQGSEEGQRGYRNGQEGFTSKVV